MRSGFYTAAEAARLARVPRSTIDYWARTALIVPSQRSERPRLYSFEDLRDLAVAQRLRHQGAGVRDMRAALEYVRSFDNSLRLARASFGVEDGELRYVNLERGVPAVAPHRHGQRVFIVAMPEVLDRLGVTDLESRVIRPADRIVIDPNVRGGTPVVDGTRIPTRLIADLLEEGLASDDVLALYPALSPEDVVAARDWEASFAA